MDVSAAGFTDMQVTAAGETGEYFLHGIFKHMPFSIQLSRPADYHGADFAFVAHTMNRASAYRQDAELFLQNRFFRCRNLCSMRAAAGLLFLGKARYLLPSRTAYSLTFVTAKLLVLRIFPAQKKYDKP